MVSTLVPFWLWISILNHNFVQLPLCFHCQIHMTPDNMKPAAPCVRSKICLIRNLLPDSKLSWVVQVARIIFIQLCCRPVDWYGPATTHLIVYFLNERLRLIPVRMRIYWTKTVYMCQPSLDPVCFQVFINFKILH